MLFCHHPVQIAQMGDSYCTGKGNSLTIRNGVKQFDTLQCLRHSTLGSGSSGSKSIGPDDLIVNRDLGVNGRSRGVICNPPSSTMELSICIEAGEVGGSWTME